jgi:predicted amidohydrolase YtcJ
MKPDLFIFDKTFFMYLKYIFSYCIFLVLFSACKFRQKISLLVHHANIYTVDKNFSTAQAMAIADGKIIAIGTNDEILKTYEGEQEVNANGKTIFPGFIDAHSHFTGFATDRWKCELTGTTSFEEVLNRLSSFTKNNQQAWVYGRGWDQNDWQVKNYPNKTALDEMYPNTPVFLKRIDGHAALVNQKALDIAGITTNTKVVGGSIEIIDGKLTGILVDNAMDLVDNKVPQIADSVANRYFEEAQKICFAFGLTGVHDCGIGEHTIALVDALQKQGILKMKIFALLSDSSKYYDKWIASGPYKTDRLNVGGFKFYADGALGSRGACLLNDYADKPNWKGFLLSDSTHYKTIFERLINTKLQACTHAIGDSANRQILKLYAGLLKGKNDKRWRIEHAQVISDNDFHFFGDFNIIPSVQPTHATSDMYWAAQRLGPVKVKGAYAYQQLLQQNNWMPLGTDFPVEDINPLKTFLAAVARQDANYFPTGGYQIENVLSREQAIRGMTVWAAKAAFEENEKGSLEKGKMADFIVVDTDLMKCTITNILKTNILATYINGEKVWTK